MNSWSSVPQDGLPAGALNLPTYPPDAPTCVHGHPFRSEDDCVLPEGYDHFLCRRCVAALIDVETQFEQSRACAHCRMYEPDHAPGCIELVAEQAERFQQALREATSSGGAS